MTEELPFVRAGSGPAFVLVHGYLGGSAQWQDQLHAFAPGHDVITPDLPGFGAAAALPGPDSIGSFAEAVLGCLDGLGIGRFALMGHSMGGMIVQEMAARAGDRVEKLVLYGTGPLGRMPDRFEPLETSMERLATEGVAATADRICATWFVKGNDATGYALARDLGRRANPQAARNALVAMRDWDGRAALAKLRMPCRIVWGDQDRSYRWPQVEALWRGIPDASLAVVPEASHAVHLEKPALFNAMIRDFLLPD
ncbi:MAG: alpha/beta hydrolase [Pseudotabrizicola sp.]|uniref:alpha/beta fold hydrolase n=1 Tax=Pseudotabrizicola sp. TaxID=2939647 RepID=UPI00271E40E0|nr:alpha/beta hydrolase [Pseudotabrizicola sp.]MDO8883310.1 alpha/beta hydrolase [Pseudotabrizicola sp.]MDP2083526.1 alpha/beta hydrolase [Pseudotabrizicola sp.]MDZ7575045.1 alpha/beta hydrolase [Pseudotabrizicola sp.]